MNKSTNHKAIKILLVIVFILLLALSVHLIKNYSILNQIAKKQIELEEISNYHYVSEHYNSEDENNRTVIEHYKKDNKSKLIVKSNNITRIAWHDKETAEFIVVYPSESKATIIQSSNSPETSIPTIAKNLYLALTSFISSDSINGQKCYKVAFGGNHFYISAENGVILKSISQEISDGKTLDNITEYKDLEINQLTNHDVARPDLTNYEILKQ